MIFVDKLYISDLNARHRIGRQSRSKTYPCQGCRQQDMNVIFHILMFLSNCVSAGDSLTYSDFVYFTPHSSILRDKYGGGDYSPAGPPRGLKGRTKKAARAEIAEIHPRSQKTSRKPRMLA